MTITQLYVCSTCMPSSPNPTCSWCYQCNPLRAAQVAKAQIRLKVAALHYAATRNMPEALDSNDSEELMKAARHMVAVERGELNQ